MNDGLVAKLQLEVMSLTALMTHRFVLEEYIYKK